MSQFAFLQAEWPAVLECAYKAETMAHADPRTACFYARRGLEVAVQWAYTNDRALTLPYKDDLSARLHEPSFKNLMGQTVFTKARVIKDLGNNAVHSQQRVRVEDAVAAVRELFHFCYWFAHTYARDTSKLEGLVFDSARLPKEAPASTQSMAQLQTMAKKLEAQDATLRERDQQLREALEGRRPLDEELERLRAELAAIKAANAAKPDTHDYSEAQTRDLFIDLLLKEAGWALDRPQDREYEVAGMPNQQEKGFVDYVLWGDDGKPLGLVEAKRTTRDARAGQQQAKLYADCLERQFGQRPVIFYTNGYEHWIWDDLGYPPRAVQGFYKKAELELMIQRRQTRRSLLETPINEAIAGRHYQTRGIRRIAETFEVDRHRKALVVMATGAGKTRTVIALADLLIRCNRAKRILFLADRVALVKQAVNAFKKHLPDASPVNLVEDKTSEGRVFVSTYPTMMGLIDDRSDGQRRFGVGHFDLVIIDEAHRSVFQKYRAIFEYFDSLLVGLTATPKEEIDRNTYGLFDLETGVPTDAYGLDEAVKDGYLVPMLSVSVPLAFQREGIKYDELTEADKEQWEALDWDEEAGVPERVEAEAVNKWLFNRDTVDKVLEFLMTRGLTVAGGDRLGKTIIFAKNNDHAEFIADRFNANYPHHKGEFARVITFKTEYAQTLIDSFSLKDRQPHIAVSVDMLDTGIDVPEVVNLVFFKVVRSKTKFHQMIGRGTRPCPNLFGPDAHKPCFYVFDFCQNLEYFSQNPPVTPGTLGASLSKRIFRARLEMIGVLDATLLEPETPMMTGEARVAWAAPMYAGELREGLANMLHDEVRAMSLDNFVVRPHRQLVETFARRDAWHDLSRDKLHELSEKVAGLPAEREAEPEEAKRFDLLVLNLQLAILRQEPAFKRLREQVVAIAGLLEEKASIPLVRDQLSLIQDVQSDEWWEDVSIQMLEAVRLRLRSLVRLIEKQKRKPIYTDFEDAIGEAVEIELPGFTAADGFERFRAKARMFLRAHQDRLAIHKLRMNKPLTPTDLQELERILIESGAGGTEDVQRAATEAKGLGLFVRSLVGLDRGAAKEALASFTAGTTPSANQLEFLDLVVNYLTENGAMAPARLYESPFTDLSPQGPDGLFPSDKVDRLVEALKAITGTATA